MDKNLVKELIIIYHKMNDTIPWIEKYRPKNIKEIVYHDEIRNTLIKLINNNKFPHTIFLVLQALVKQALF